jgi:hypothetical protein
MCLLAPGGLGVITFGRPWLGVIAMVSPLAFLCAFVLVFLRPAPGYVLGGIAGMIALPWFVLTEINSPSSIWIFLNILDPNPEAYPDLYPTVFVILKILSVALISVAIACSLLRMLPSSVQLRNSPLSRRTWPAIAIGILVLAVWLPHSAMPWMLPGIVDGRSPELRILHVEKRGTRFRETSVSAARDGKFTVSTYGRRLFQYRFRIPFLYGLIPPVTLEQAHRLAHSSALRSLRTAPPKALRAWNAEGWYIALEGSPLLAFTTEYGTTPPAEITDVLRQIEKLPGIEAPSWEVADVCFGFCYDPRAGLGFRFTNQRCEILPSGKTQCN